MNESSERWTTESIMKCLQYYHRFPCLWDVDNIDYKNKQKREHALSEMAACFNMSSEMMKKKIHSMRNAYINEIARINRHFKSGDTAYVTKLPWFKFADSFLGKVVRRKSNFSALAPISLRFFNENTQSGPSEQSENIRESNIELSLPSSSLSPSTEQSSQLTYIDKDKIKRQKLESDTSDTAADLLLQEALSTLKCLLETSTTDKNDEITIFGQSVTSQLRKLPEEYLIECMSEIQNVITLKRLKYLNSRLNR